jgi:hypothetical protein
MIRRDLFAVQLLESADVGRKRESWTVIGIARSRRGAKRIVNDQADWNAASDFQFITRALLRFRSSGFLGGPHG